MIIVEQILELDPKGYTGEEQLLVVVLQEMVKAYIDGNLADMVSTDA